MGGTHIISEKCAGCEVCVALCPIECISLVDNKAVINEADCVDCGGCIEECTDKAIVEA